MNSFLSRSAIKAAGMAAVALAFASLVGFAQEKTRDSDIIHPRNAAGAGAAPAATATKSGGDSSYLLIVLATAAAAAGGFMLWRQRRTPGGIAGRDARKLNVAESRSLGNRQYLVVADYDGKKFLLGVCPGSIQLLSPLEEGERAAHD
ncbi:MAG: flagellar biosynthetic protein FliO [Opitutae bacterium]|nr:flagellar biosynthetic protein FliO [Opitutae bacterium]